jgi:hypothetical protein
MEVLEIEGIVEGLINCLTIISAFPYLELQHEYDGSDEQYDINASAHTRNRILKKYSSFVRDQDGLEKVNFFTPRSLLFLNVGEFTATYDFP